MSLLKYIERLKRMDDLIRRKATGDVNCFALKLGISRSQISQDLHELRNIGVPIKYCKYRKTYFYEGGVGLTINFAKNSSNQAAKS
ncbi:MAG: hypothetical protein K2U26_17565 [Cyclobacteriaceae bacterium]|nr:hypothetical protein [Cyclobacteriaceae bacterium]